MRRSPKQRRIAGVRCLRHTAVRAYTMPARRHAAGLSDVLSDTAPFPAKDRTDVSSVSPSVP